MFSFNINSVESHKSHSHVFILSHEKYSVLLRNNKREVFFFFYIYFIKHNIQRFVQVSSVVFNYRCRTSFFVFFFCKKRKKKERKKNKNKNKLNKKKYKKSQNNISLWFSQSSRRLLIWNILRICIYSIDCCLWLVNSC